MRARFGPLLMCGVLLSLAGCGGGQTRPAKAPTSIQSVPNHQNQPKVAPALHHESMVLDFIPTGYQAPFYLGVKNGIYRKHGIDLSIVVGHGSAEAVQELGSGKFPFGFADVTTAAIAMSRGVPLKAVAVYLQRNPFGVIYRAQESFSKPADLVGKRVGLNPEGAAKKLFQAMLGANGVPMSKVKIVGMPGSALIAALAKHKVDAIVLTNLTALPRLKALGVKARAMLVSNWGVRALSEGLVVNTGFLAAHPDIVRSFVQASQEAWTEAEKDPQAAVAAQAKALGPTLAPKGALGTLQLSFTLLHTKLSAGHPIGWMAPGDWTDTLKLLRKDYGVKHTLSPSSYYTDEFITPQSGTKG